MRHLLRRTLVLATLAATVLALASPALAHTDLATSDPAHGDTLTSPVERIELTFTGPVDLSPELVQLYDSNQTELKFNAWQDSPDAVTVEPSVPLDGDRFVIRWKTLGDDGHERSGFVAFTVQHAETTTTVAQGIDPAPPVATTRVAVANVTGEVPVVPIQIDTNDYWVGTALAWIGRWTAMVGTLMAIGAFAFAATSLRGREEEVRFVFGWVRIGGLLVLVGTALEVLGLSAGMSGSLLGGLAPSELVDLVGSHFGIAVLLRLAGGIALLQDPSFVTVVVSSSSSRSTASESSTQGSVIAEATPRTAESSTRLEAHHEWLAMIGMLLVAASYMFHGHTVGVEATALARAASLTHVLAAGVWAGGIAAFAAVLHRRRRGGRPAAASGIAVRFSRVAAASLTLVATAGLVLAWTIVDNPASLMGSQWGRILVMKVGLVAVVGLLGGYNHFVVVPKLEANPGDAASQTYLRRTITTEAAILLSVTMVTAFLIVAVS